MVFRVLTPLCLRALLRRHPPLHHPLYHRQLLQSLLPQDECKLFLGRLLEDEGRLPPIAIPSQVQDQDQCRTERHHKEHSFNLQIQSVSFKMSLSSLGSLVGAFRAYSSSSIASVAKADTSMENYENQMVDHNPGLLDGSVLYNQENHISEQIWKGKERGPLRAIPVNSKEDTWELNENQWELIRQTGLHHLAKIEKIKIDHSLISALVERWRPETNRFHLNSGEATITLEDVAHIYGLPIDGPPITGHAFSSFDQVQSVCNDLLRVTPDVNYDCNGVQIKLKWIRDNFAAAPKTRTIDYDQRQTRAYLFSLVAWQIVSSSGGSGTAYILELFRKFEKYAWGSACLANLYRSLAKITIVSKAGKPIRSKRNKGKDEDASSKTLTGPLQLLQIWAYSRIRIGRPISEPRDWKVKIQLPLCKMWARRLQNHHHLTSILEVRAQLDSQSADDFVWTPYNDVTGLSKFVNKTDKALFTSSTVLIYFWVAERHCTERVMKQFGLVQIVPPTFLRPLDYTERATLMPVNYKDKLKKVNDMWNKRLKLVIKGDIDDGSLHSDGYFEWYKSITRLHIGRPQIRTIQGDLLNDGDEEYPNVLPESLKSVPEFVTGHIFKFSNNLLSSIDEAAKCHDQSQ